MVRKGGLEQRYHIDNTQLIDSPSGLKAQNPHNPVPIVRLLYDELALYDELGGREKPYQISCSIRSLTSFHSPGQGLTSAIPRHKANCNRRPCRDLVMSSTHNVLPKSHWTRASSTH